MGLSTGSNPASGVTIDAPTSKTTAPDTGAANFPLRFAGGTGGGNVTFTETVQPGYTLQQVGSSNATCTPTLDTNPATAVPDHQHHQRLHGERIVDLPDQLRGLQQGPEPPGLRCARQTVDDQRDPLHQWQPAHRLPGHRYHQRNSAGLGKPSGWIRSRHAGHT